MEGLPAGNLGTLLYDSQPRFLPFGNGILCVGGTVQRVTPPLQANPLGQASVSIDLTQPPFGSGPAAIAPESNWTFQFRYRDPTAGGAGFDSSDAVHVVFAP